MNAKCRRIGLFLLSAMIAVPLTACQNSANLTSLVTSVSEDQAVSTQKGNSSDLARNDSDPDKRIENDSVPYYFSGPLFTYNISEEALLAYCYVDTSIHEPYVLSDEAKTDGSVNEYTFEEYDETVYYFFDSDYDIWRVFSYQPETPMVYEDNSSMLFNENIEYNVFYDRMNIVNYADSLNRMKYSVCVPRYVRYDEALFYSARNFDPEAILSGELVAPSIDMDGDGKDEEIYIGEYFSNDTSLGDYAVAINREIVLNDSNVHFLGASIIDINTEDAYKEIICWFEGADMSLVQYVIRYMDGNASYQIFSAILDVEGDGTLAVRSGAFLDSRFAVTTYSVSDDYTFTEIPRLYEMYLEITAISSVPVKFLQDGVYVDGFLNAGEEITCYQTDFASLVYFRTSDEREGIFSVSETNIEPGDIASYDCFDGLFFGG